MRPMLLTTENNVIRVLAARRYASARALAMALCLCHQWRNYGDRGGTLYPQVQDLYPLHPPSQRCGLCQNFKRTTLTTRLYKVQTNLYPPPLTKTVRRACVLQVGVLSKRIKESSWFWHGGFLQPVLHCFERKSGHLKK